MSCLHYRDNELWIENVSLKKIAENYGTPCYLYSRAKIVENWHVFDQAFSAIEHHISYAVKANSNIAILQLLAQLNAGFDIVSQGELERVIVAGGKPDKIVFSGVGKTHEAIKAAIQQRIHCFNVESIAELERINHLASQFNQPVQIAFRVNPNVNPHTHTYISTGLKENKFGIDLQEIIPLARTLSHYPFVQLIGIACHIGSQITTLEPFVLALERLVMLYHDLHQLGIPIQQINIGGGLGIPYHNENPPTVTAYAQAICETLAHLPIALILEPGRSIVGDAGILLTRVEYLKHQADKNFAIVDAGMNDLLRPALYQAWQPILPVEKRTEEAKPYDIAGPVCESSDVLGKERILSLQPADFLAIDKVGAYGFSMSSTYNSRPKPCEILVDQDKTHIIRRRETIPELFAAENLLS